MSIIEAPTRGRLFPVVRYPGGKRGLLRFLSGFLPQGAEIAGRYIEPFVGGAAVFLFINPADAILADANQELIDLYRGLQQDPDGVWKAYEAFGPTKDDYFKVRSQKPNDLDPTPRAARLLYLNRTCFKGNWRHNANGEFNVGYGGQSRRWVITPQLLLDVGRALRSATLRCADFEATISAAVAGDFLFADPPYRRGERELRNAHYGNSQFRLEDHQRLAASLRSAADRGVTWCLTTSSHDDIVSLFNGFHVMPVPSKSNSGEVLIHS
jgi:DNA adenine methylase